MNDYDNGRDSDRLGKQYTVLPWLLTVIPLPVMFIISIIVGFQIGLANAGASAEELARIVADSSAVKTVSVATIIVVLLCSLGAIALIVVALVKLNKKHRQIPAHLIVCLVLAALVFVLSLI